MTGWSPCHMRTSRQGEDRLSRSSSADEAWKRPADAYLPTHGKAFARKSLTPARRLGITLDADGAGYVTLGT
jgi:hypothetical protein